MVTTKSSAAAALPASLFWGGQRYVLSPAVGQENYDSVLSITASARSNGDILERSTQEVSTSDAHALFLLRDSRGVAVGCFGIEAYDDCWELFSFCVALDFRGLGIGAAMLQLAADCSIAERKKLLAMSRSAPAWFAKFGFQPTAHDILPDARRARVDASRGSVLMSYRPDQSQLRRVTLSISGKLFLYNPALDRSILDAAERHQIKMESLCNSGLCGMCSVALQGGNYRTVLDYPFTPREGEIMPCISEPLSDLILEA